MMKLSIAERKKAKLKMALQGSAGAGKTLSALLIAYGLCQDWTKIAVIDTENHSADLYAHLGSYNVLPLSAPYEPEKYVDALYLCKEAGMQVIIIDSTSHAWDYLLDIHANMQGNSFTNWSKITPRQNGFINTILQLDIHVIATMRVKQDYVLTDKDGKKVPEKVGLKAVQRDGVDYEFTLVLDIDIKHYATASKDRTGLFMDKPPFIIKEATGKKLAQWCNTGAEPPTLKDRIEACTNTEQLKELYLSLSFISEEEQAAFSTKKASFSTNPSNPPTHSNHLKLNNNGSFTIQQH